MKPRTMRKTDIAKYQRLLQALKDFETQLIDEGRGHEDEHGRFEPHGISKLTLVFGK